MSPQASPRVNLDENLVKTLHDNIFNQDPSDTAFDEVQARVWDILQNDPKYYPAFRKSQLYIKLLAELDLLKDSSAKGDDDSSSMDADNASVSSHSSSRAVSWLCLMLCTAVVEFSCQSFSESFNDLSPLTLHLLNLR